MRPEEHAAGASRSFPEEWGPPPGRTFSPERASWVRFHARQHAAQAEVRNRDAARRSAVTRLATLVAKRYAPGEGPDAR